MHGKVHCLLRIVLHDLDARMRALVVEAPVVDTLWDVVGGILEHGFIAIDPGGALKSVAFWPEGRAVSTRRPSSRAPAGSRGQCRPFQC